MRYQWWAVGGRWGGGPSGTVANPEMGTSIKGVMVSSLKGNINSGFWGLGIVLEAGLVCFVSLIAVVKKSSERICGAKRKKIKLWLKIWLLLLSSLPPPPPPFFYKSFETEETDLNTKCILLPHGGGGGFESVDIFLSSCVVLRSDDGPHSLHEVELNEQTVGREEIHNYSHFKDTAEFFGAKINFVKGVCAGL
jgi:hypothetical protein